MKRLMTAVFTLLLSWCPASDANAVFVTFSARLAGYDPATDHDYREYKSVQCIPVASFGHLCFMPNFVEGWTGYNMCNNGVFIDKDFLDRSIQFIKTPKFGAYVLYLDSSGTAGGGSHYFIYVSGDGKLFYTELFSYIDTLLSG